VNPEVMPDCDFEKFASACGEGCLVVFNTIKGRDGNTMVIPNFKIEDGMIIQLTDIEAEAELIVRRVDRINGTS